MSPEVEGLNQTDLYLRQKACLCFAAGVEVNNSARRLGAQQTLSDREVRKLIVATA